MMLSNIHANNVALVISVFWLTTGLTVLRDSAALAGDQEQAAVQPIIVSAPHVLEPKNRGGSGPRGAAGSAEAFLLAPDKTGATFSRQPALYWFLTAETGSDIELMITATDERGVPREEEPVVKKLFTGRRSPGLHVVNLQTEGVNLNPGQRYLVNLLLTNSADHSDDCRSTADFVVLDASHDQSQRDIAALAKAGVWYDVVAQILKRIAAGANDAARQQLVATLRQEHSFCSYARSDLAPLDADAKQLEQANEENRLKAFAKLEDATVKVK